MIEQPSPGTSWEKLQEELGFSPEERLSIEECADRMLAELLAPGSEEAQ